MAAEERPEAPAVQNTDRRLQEEQRWKRQLLRTCVPVNALTEDHLNTLLRETRIEAAYRGQRLFERGACDDCHVYLLSGCVELHEPAGMRLVHADDPEAHYPLAHQQPRPLTAVARDDCQLIRFDSARLDAMLAWDQAATYIELDIAGSRDLDEDADWMLTLLRSNLFYKVPPMNIRQILNRFHAEFRAAGEVVIRQGELGDCCYFIKEGGVSVYLADDERARSELVAELGVGRCFGEDALVNDAPRNATIVMRTNGVLMRLDKQDFFLLLKSPPVHWVSYAQLSQLWEQGAELLDVRTLDEFDQAHAEGAQQMPLSILKLKSRLLDSDKTYIAYCNSGRRAAAAAYLLGEDGYRVVALRGGVDDLSPEQRLAFLQRGDPEYRARLRDWQTG